MSDAERMLFDFTEPDAAAGWRTIDDPVMGGVSSSRFEGRAHGAAAFAGTVSLDRGGGFASVRAPAGMLDLQAFDGLRLRVRGDGKRYKLTAYTHGAGPISYRYPFRAPADEWTEITAPFDALRPFRRGRAMPEAPPFDPSGVRTVGLLIGDKQAGAFEMEIDWIKAVVLA